MPRRTAVAVAGAILAAALVACGTDSGDGPRASVPVRSGESAYDVVASGLDAPWSIVFHRSIPLVSERDSGRIVEIGPAREVLSKPGNEYTRELLAANPNPDPSKRDTVTL